MTQTTERTEDSFYETRAAAVYAYCWRLCPADRISTAVDAAFARAGASDRELRNAVRRAAAEHTALTGSTGDYCRTAARLLATRAGGDLTHSEEVTLRGHLARCDPCRSLAARFEDAERALEALMPNGAARPLAPIPEPAEAAPVAPPPESAPVAEPPEPAPVGEPAEPASVGEPAEPASVGEPAESAPVVEAPEPSPSTLAPEAERAPAVESSPSTLAPEAERAPAVEPSPTTPAPESEPAPAPLEHAKDRRRTFPRPRLGPAARRHLSAVLLVLGVLLIAEAITTVVWKEPFTAYLASRAQAALRGELARLDRAPTRLDAAQQRSLAALPDARRRTARRLELLADSLAAHVRSGRALGWIEIPRIGVDYVFVQGTGAASLRKGPAHYTQTPLPGAPGTVGIAGHRTTYLAPFRDIDELKRGDRIVIRMPYGRFVYAVERHRIVPAGVTNAFEPAGYARLVLSACHPLYSASHRILVSARLVSVQPLGGTATDTRPARPGAAQVARDLAVLGDRELSLGKRGPDVRALQRLLGVPTTGYFGYQTQSAVEDFARAHGLDTSGVVDEPLKRALAERGPPTAPPTPPAVAPQQ
jgi:sortase A